MKPAILMPWKFGGNTWIWHDPYGRLWYVTDTNGMEYVPDEWLGHKRFVFFGLKNGSTIQGSASTLQEVRQQLPVYAFFGSGGGDG